MIEPQPKTCYQCYNYDDRKAQRQSPWNRKVKITVVLAKCLLSGHSITPQQAACSYFSTTPPKVEEEKP